MGVRACILLQNSSPDPQGLAALGMTQGFRIFCPVQSVKKLSFAKSYLELTLLILFEYYNFAMKPGIS
jgi:hypothetical protein